MAISISIDARGGQVVIQRIEQIRERLSDFRSVTTVAAVEFEAMIQESFENSQSPNGEGWSPLSDTTKARRRGSVFKPLVDTGQLRRSIFSRPDSDGRSFRFGVSGAASTYAPTHQFGSATVPRRAFLPLDLDGELDLSSGRAAEWRERTLRRFEKYIATGKLR